MRATQAHRLPPALVAAVARCESNWDPRARSPRGARGLMQVMPRTAAGAFRLDPELLWEPEINIQVGAAYLGRLARRYGGDAARAVAAYNAGPGRIDRGRRLPAETRRFLACVGRWYTRYRPSFEAGP